MSPNDAPPVAEIVERLVATDNLPDELHGVQHQVEEYGGGRKETRYELWERLPNEVRTEVLSAEVVREFDFELEIDSAPVQASYADGREGTTVQNERGSVVYDAEANRYRRYEYEPPDDQSGHTTDPSFVGSTPQIDFDVTYEGSDTVAGRETHVLTFRPTADADSFTRSFDSITMWVDGAYWFPLAHEATYQLRKEGILQTTEEDPQNQTYFQKHTFEDVEFDIGIEDARFQFDPPDDAERVE